VKVIGRPPDALDAGRTAAIMLLAMAGIGELRHAGVPPAYRLGLMQACFFVVPLVYALWAGLRPLRDAGFVRPRLRDLVLTLVASMASLWILKALLDVQLDVYSHLGRQHVAVREREQIERTLVQAQDTAGLMGLSLFAIIPPLCEEMLFRGLLLRGLARSFGAGIALVGTALLFAALHLKETQFVLMTFLGLYFGALSWLTGSLWPSILAHAINNGAVLVLQVGWGPRVQDFRAPWPILALSVLVLAGVLTLLGLDRRARNQGLEAGRPSPGP
jgi:membrane protease YdiL (CAAX protease family)